MDKDKTVTTPSATAEDRGNVYWRDLDDRSQITDNGASFSCNGRLIYWHGQEASEAQNWLADTAQAQKRAADKTRNHNVQIACGPPRLEGETLAQYIEKTSEPKPAGTVKQGRRPMFKPFDKIAHTPGPWTVRLVASMSTIFPLGNPNPVAHVCACFSIDTEQANARLIAAAPELLELLKDAKRCARGLGGAWQEKAKAAIDKATKAL